MICPVITDRYSRIVYKQKKREDQKYYKKSYPGCGCTKKTRYIFPAQISVSICSNRKIQKQISTGNEYRSRNYHQDDLEADYPSDIKSEQFQTVLYALHPTLPDLFKSRKKHRRKRRICIFPLQPHRMQQEPLPCYKMPKPA